MNSGSPKTKIEYAIVCDDARREDNGKLIIIGAYASDIGVPKYPADLALTVVLALRTDSAHPVSIDVRVKQEARVIFEGRSGKEFELPQDRIALVSIGRAALRFTKDAEIDFQVRIDGGRFRSVCKLPVHKIQP